MTSEQQSEYVSEIGYEGGESVGFADQTTGGIEEEEDLDEKYSKLGSSDDSEQKKRYLDYLQLTKEIEAQNRTVQQIKQRILDLCNKPCKTACDERDIRQLRNCMETENLKMKCLIAKAIDLQNHGSRRRWTDLPITTTFDEDNIKPYVTCTSPPKYAIPGTPSEDPCSPEDSQEMPCLCQDYFPKKSKPCPKPCPPPCPDSESEEDQHLQAMLCALKKLKITCPEDKMLLCEVMQSLAAQKARKPCPRKQRPRRQRSMPCQDDSQHDEMLKHLNQKVCCMQDAVAKIKREICKRKKAQQKRSDAQSCPEMTGDVDDAIEECGGKLSSKQEQIDKLKESYCYLLTEYARKEAQLNELKTRAGDSQAFIAKNGKNKELEESELCLLRARVSELKEEQQEFKCIMKEQATQLEDYRNKYLSAQQKVEEQCVLLEKLNMNNKRIEKQINCEVKEIRNKFQEKLTELLHFPKLLENEQLKVAELTKQRDDLEQKLVLVCKELSAANEQNSPKESRDLGPQLAECQAQYEQLQKQYCELERQRDLTCEQLRTTQDDLDTLRSESAKIIARTKERTELIRQQQQECINKLERELAQCRATACLSVSDREAVIREMQGQLNALSFSFDSAQKQIKTLRNHIAYVSNENCYPVKCP